MSDFFEGFLPTVDMCCFSINLFIGAVFCSFICLASFTAQFYKGSGFTKYYLIDDLTGVNGILGIIQIIPLVPLLICAFVGLALTLVFFVGFCAEIPLAIGLGLVFFGLLLVPFEIIWIIIAVIRAFFGGGFMAEGCDPNITCWNEMAVLGFFIPMALAFYCYIIIKSYTLNPEDEVQ